MGMKKRIYATSIAMTMIIGTMGMSYASNMGDVENHWAATQIKKLVDKGVVSGYKDNTFKPDNNITRAEFISLLNKAYGFNSSNDISYKDVSSNDWYYNDVKKAKAQGYISGYQDNTIKPNNKITRQEVAVIMSKVLNKQNMNKGSVVDKFKDKDQIASWAREAIGVMIDSGYMNGYPDGTFAPDRFITRAEAVTMLDKVLNKPVETPVVTTSSTTATVKDKNELRTAVDNKKIEKIELSKDIDLGSSDFTISRLVNIDLEKHDISGSIKIDTSGEGKMTIEDGKLKNDLTINAPKADFTNKATVAGKTIIKDIKGSTFINEGTLAKVYIEDNDIRFVNNSSLDAVVIDTTGEVRLEGNIKELQINKSATIKIENKIDKIIVEKDVNVDKLKVELKNKGEVKDVEVKTDKKVTIGNKEYTKKQQGTDSTLQSLKVGSKDISLSSTSSVIKLNKGESISSISAKAKDSNATVIIKLDDSKYNNTTIKENSTVTVEVKSEDGKNTTTYKVKIEVYKEEVAKVPDTTQTTSTTGTTTQPQTTEKPSTPGTTTQPQTTEKPSTPGTTTQPQTTEKPSTPGTTAQPQTTEKPSTTDTTTQPQATEKPSTPDATKISSAEEPKTSTTPSTNK